MPHDGPQHAQAPHPDTGMAGGARAPQRNLPTAKGMTHFERATVCGRQVDVFFGEEHRTDVRGRPYLRMLAVDPDLWNYCYVTAYAAEGRSSFKGVDIRDGARFDGEVSLDSRMRPLRGTLSLRPSAPRREQAAREAAERAARRGLRKVDPAVEAAAQKVRDEEQSRVDAAERHRLHEAQLAAMVAGLRSRRASQGQADRDLELRGRQEREARERAERLEREEHWRLETARRAKAEAARRAAQEQARTTTSPSDPVIVQAEQILRGSFKTPADVRSARVRISKLMHPDVVGHERYSSDFGGYNKRLDDIGRRL